MNIVCYGDSNTYGFNPLDGGRYETCWVDIVRANYKDDFVVNAGLNGRLAEPRQFLYDVTFASICTYWIISYYARDK